MSPGKRTRKTRGSNICWPALADAVHTIERSSALYMRRTPKCEYLCGGSFMSISFSFFFLSFSRREMRESTQKKKHNITHDYIHEFYYYFEELYLCYYFIKWADAVGHYHFLEHSNNPCHLSLSLCVQLPFAHLPRRPCNSSLALSALVRGDAIRRSASLLKTDVGGVISLNSYMFKNDYSSSSSAPEIHE